MFDKGFSYKTPFTFKLTSANKYFMTINQKCEFVPKDSGLALDWEYKLRHERNCCAGSLLCANNKVETELEGWPCSKKKCVIKGKAGFMANTGELNPNEIFPYWKVYGDLELKYHGIKNFFGTLKLVKGYGVKVPSVTLTGLYRFKPQGIITGASCTIDTNVEKPWIKPFEFLIGYMHKKNNLIYLKHSAVNTSYPGKITAGLFKSCAFDYT